MSFIDSGPTIGLPPQVSGMEGAHPVSLLTQALLEKAPPQVGPYSGPVVLPITVAQLSSRDFLQRVTASTGEQPPIAPTAFPLGDVVVSEPRLNLAPAPTPSPPAGTSPSSAPPVQRRAPYLPDCRPALQPVVTSVSLLSLAEGQLISDEDMAYHRQHPLTTTNLNRFLAVEYEAITRVLTAEQEKLAPESPASKALGKLLDRSKTARNARAGCVIDHGTAGERVDMPAEKRAEELKRLESFKKGIAAFFSQQKLGDFTRLLDEQKVALLRTAAWPEVKSEVQFSSGEMARHIQTPAARLLRYGGIRGVPSLDSASEHLPNLWADRYDVRGRELFHGYRHATLAPFGPDMTDARAALIAEVRAKELLQAMVLDDPNLCNVQDGGEVSLKVSSVSLLTPDRWRGAVVGLKGRKSERAMWKLQQAAGVEPR